MPYIQKTRVRDGVDWTSSRSQYDVKSQDISGVIPREVQMIFTEDHPGYKTADGHRDMGGEFESWKVEIPVSGFHWNSKYLFGNYGYPVKQGWNTDTTTYLVPSAEIAQLATQINGLKEPGQISSWISNPVRCPQGPNVLTMDAMGSKAVDIVQPVNPSVDLATTLAELWSERKFFSLPGKNDGLAGEYLNYQFGIAPTLSDYQDLRDTIEHADGIIRQYQRDAGRVVRREYRFKPEVQVSRSESTAAVFGLGHGLTYNQCSTGRLIKKTTTTQKYWFAGAFKYSIPQGAFPERMSELDRLYGVVPGVSTGWELIPFSWLVDYFVPIGGILSNLDAFLKDGLVMPYAYIMSTTEVVDEYDWLGPIRGSGGDYMTVGVQAVVKKTRLRRRRANPFGFGLLGTDLSPQQLSIIAALGITLRK